MEASRTAISREHATASQRKLTSGTGTTGEARNAATEASEARAANATSNARRSLIASSVEPPDTDPNVRWCGRGGVVRRPPIPIACVTLVAYARWKVAHRSNSAEWQRIF